MRVALRPDELAAHPLRVGLSMDVKIDVHDLGGKTLADAPRQRPVASTGVFDDLERDADARVRQIIASNGVPDARGAADSRAVAAGSRPQVVAVGSRPQAFAGTR